MKIPGEHLQMNTFSEKSMHPIFRTCVDKLMFTDGGQTDGQGEPILFAGGIKSLKK